MTLLWTTPRDWVSNEVITKEKLNAISNDLRYLYNPASAVATIRGTGADVNVTSTTPAELNDTLYALSVELTGNKDVLIEFQGYMRGGAAAAATMIDFLIDGSVYASSLTGTYFSGGVSRHLQVTALLNIPVSIHYVIPAGSLAAGVHTFKPRLWVSASTSIWYMSTNYLSQFRVGEN